MTEKAKMLAGALYRSSDPALLHEHARAQALLTRFNRTSAADSTALATILEELLGALGDGAIVKPRFACDYGTQIRLGRGTFINYDAVFLDCAAITLGDDVLLGPGVHLYTAQHPVEPAMRRDGLEYALPITIGDNAWLGGRVVVCPGVTIGADTVVAAGSVVVHDLPAGVVAAGSPCRVLRDVHSGPPHRARQASEASQEPG